MTATHAPVRAGPQAGAKPPRSARLLRALGWTLIAAGTLVLLYLVYALWFTNLETAAEQSRLAERWEGTLEVQPPARGDVDEAAAVVDGWQLGFGQGSAAPAGAEADREDEPAVAPGDPVAALEFRRPGADEPPVRAEPLYVVSGVGVDDLRRGPGHYPTTALPGEEGNFGVAGHRTTYGAPFFHLDELEPGDEVHVTDRSGQRHVYRVAESRITGPAANWVLGPDPLDRGAPTLTLTTCHPRFSNAERLIVFAELVA